MLGGAVIGGNVAHWINLIGAVVFLVAGMAMMILLQTDLNFLGFTMATCIVSFVIGLVLFTAGLYGKTGTRRGRPAGGGVPAWARDPIRTPATR